MNFKKFISGVSAFAIAASAFAAMAVTASADTDYTKNATGAMMTQGNISHDSSFTFTADSYEAGTDWSAVSVDFTSMPNITKASLVQVEFDAVVNSGIPEFWIAVGDKSVRGSNVGGSGKTSYKTSGIAFRLGSDNGSDFFAQDGKTGRKMTIGNTYFGKTIHVKVEGRKTGKYSFWITDKDTDAEITKFENTSIASGVNNFTVLEAYTNVPGATFTLKNVKVSYTVPAVDMDLTNYAHFDGDDGSEAVIVNDTVSGVYTVDKIKINSDKGERTFVRGTDYVFGTNFNGSEVELAIIVNGVSEVTAIAIN